MDLGTFFLQSGEMQIQGGRTGRAGPKFGMVNVWKKNLQVGLLGTLTQNSNDDDDKDNNSSNSNKSDNRETVSPFAEFTFIGSGTHFVSKRTLRFALGLPSHVTKYCLRLKSQDHQILPLRRKVSVLYCSCMVPFCFWLFLLFRSLLFLSLLDCSFTALQKSVYRKFLN